MLLGEARVVLSTRAPVHEEPIVLELEDELIVSRDEERPHRHDADRKAGLVAQCWMKLPLGEVVASPVPVDAEHQSVEVEHGLEDDTADDLDNRRPP